MKKFHLLKLLIVAVILNTIIVGCKKDEESYPPIPDAVYIIAKVNTGPYPGAATSVGKTAKGKVSVSPASARVYVNTPKDFDVTINYSLSGTAVEGVNYTTPDPMSVTIPAGKYFTDIKIPVINTPILPLPTSTKTIIITLTSATNNVGLGLGVDKNYTIFTYTLEN